MSLQVPENLIRLIKDVITVLMTYQGRSGGEIAGVVEHIEGRRFSDMFEAYMENVQMLTERTHELEQHNQELEQDKQELEQTLLEKDQRLEESEQDKRIGIILA
jgi:predicted RNase H-like nuclease (RuvC/YqgF family)